MADTKISALTSVGSVVGTDEFAVNESGTSKKATVSQLATFVAPPASNTVAGIIEIAIQAEMEAGVDVTLVVPPGLQQFHPSAAKFWVDADGNSTVINSSHNMDSWADTGTGVATGTITDDFADTNWCGQVSVLDIANRWTATTQGNATGFGFSSKEAGTFAGREIGRASCRERV